MDQEENRTQEDIHNKGFDMVNNYGKIKVGVKTLDDAVLNLGSLQSKVMPKVYTKANILSAIAYQDLDELREISNFFYRMDGIYQSVCNLAANLYRYDWYLAAEVMEGTADKVNKKKMLIEYAANLSYLDKSYIKKLCGEIALSVVKNGVYYGYLVDNKESILIQELPVKYCRNRYNIAGSVPAVEFDMRFFDNFRDIQYRKRVLKLFPEEFQKGYALYLQGKLKEDMFDGRFHGSWYLLEPGKVVKFCLYGSEIPFFINAIPDLIDLDAAKDLDRRKQMQQLLKIIVQEVPRDKNGDLIFDLEEAKTLHDNAIEMLSRAVGVDLLTTFMDVKSVDISDKSTRDSSSDYVDKAKDAAFDSFGVPANLFNPDGNLAMDKAVLVLESVVRNMLYQFQCMFDMIIQRRSKSRNWNFRFYMMETTQFNYRDMARMYKEQTQIGTSKLLQQIALGHSQSFILNSIAFENDVLDLPSIMIPPLMSSTLNAQDVLNRSPSKGPNLNDKKSTADSGTGRPEKPDDQKSDKTIANKEAIS